jgi:aminoglycoside phosphotransferase
MDDFDTATHKWLTGIVKTSIESEKHSYSNQDDVYKIQTTDKVYYLKVADDLHAEHINLGKIISLLSVPAILGYQRINHKDHLLLTEIPGKNLAEYVGSWSNEEIVRKFAKAIRNFHAVDKNELFPENTDSEFVVLHDDMSLPNVIYTEQGFSGYIDLAQMPIGNPDTDLADAIWSLQRNLGPDYGELVLERVWPNADDPKD